MENFKLDLGLFGSTTWLSENLYRAICMYVPFPDVQTENTASSFGSSFVPFFFLDFYDCTWSLPVPRVPSRIFSILFHTLGNGE